MAVPRHFLSILLVLLVAMPVQAGSEDRPEILDSPTDTQVTAGTTVPHLDITKGWVQVKEGLVEFTAEVSGAPELPKDTVVVFHYTWGGLRLYWMANWSASGEELEFFGGAYQGTPASDRFGNTQYLYLRGPRGDNVTGEFHSGAPAKLVWKYPLANFGDQEEQDSLSFTGMFISTYVRESTDDGGQRLTMFDFAEGDDFRHVRFAPWYERLMQRFLPGPSVPVVVLALLGVAAVVAGRMRGRGGGPDA